MDEIAEEPHYACVCVSFESIQKVEEEEED